MHPLVPMIHALANHVEQLVALPDELREMAIRKYNGFVTAVVVTMSAACKPIARLIQACGQLQTQIKLPACLSLGVAGRDTSWRALFMHLRMQASAPGTSQQLIEDADTVAKTWAAIRRRFRRRGVRLPRQLLFGSNFGLVPESMRKKPA